MDYVNQSITIKTAYMNEVMKKLRKLLEQYPTAKTHLQWTTELHRDEQTTLHFKVVTKSAFFYGFLVGQVINEAIQTVKNGLQLNSERWVDNEPK